MLHGSVALVTGAAGGIGSAIARSLAIAGADLGISDVDSDRLGPIAREISELGRRALVIPADLLVQEQVETMMAEAFGALGRLDILVNCAGAIVLKSFDETTIEEYRRQMDLHYMATVIACKSAVPIMKKQRSGKIISMSSISGTIGYAHHSAYSPAKGAIIRFSEAIAQELKPYHITVNCIAPNAVDTGLFDNWIRETNTHLDRTDWIQPHEIGELAVFLSSPAARSITGATIVVQGVYDADA